MGTGKITKRTVEGIAVPGRGKNHLWDDTVKGFGVSVTSNDVRSYLLQYRMGGRGTPTKTFTIGRHGSPWTAESARKRALDLKELVRQGIDPRVAHVDNLEKGIADATLRQRLAFDTYADFFVVQHAEKRGLRSSAEIRAVLDRDAKPFFKGKAIFELKRADITRCLDGVGERSASAANKVHKWLNKLFNFAVDRGDVAASPMDRMRAPYRQSSRERVLSDAEVKAVYRACEEMGYPFGPMIKLLLLTGLRLREVANCTWNELNLERKEWEIPGRRMKNGQTYIYPISSAMAEVIASLPHVDSTYVFSTKPGRPVSGFSKAKMRIDSFVERAGVVSAPGTFVAAWTLHDLRRTLATGCQRLGIPIAHTEALLSHTGKRSGIIGVYQLHEYYSEKAEAAERWGSFVRGLTSEPQS